MAVVVERDGDYVAACDFKLIVNEEGDFDGSGILKDFKKGDRLKQSIAVRLLRKLPEWVEKASGDEVKPVTFEDIKKAEDTHEPSKLETEEEWLSKNKSAQVNKLKELGISPEDIKKLSTEKDRVNKIVELIHGN